MPEAEFIKKFLPGALIYTQCYLQFLHNKIASIDETDREIRNAIDSAADGSLQHSTVWKYIDYMGQILELFDDLAVLLVNSSGNIKQLEELISGDKEASQNFFHRGSNKHKHLTLQQKRSLYARASGINGFYRKKWYRDLEPKDRGFVKQVLDREVLMAGKFFQAIYRLDASFRLLHNKNKHAPGCIFIPEQTTSPKKNVWLIAITTSIGSGGSKNKCLPLSIDMLDIWREAAQTTKQLLAYICDQNMIRVGTHDRINMPHGLLCASPADAQRFDALTRSNQSTIVVDNITMNLVIRVRKKQKSLIDDPKRIWASYFTTQ